MPDAALSPLIETVRNAAAHKSALRIQGGGSKEFLGQTPEGETLDTRTLSGVVSYEPSELVVTARAGTPVAELESLLAAQGQCLPFEPPRFGPSGTVGGMIAAGLSGPARVSVGAVRDYVLGITLVNGRGELLTFGGQVMKNVAGYDVSRLMAGAMGTLGVLVEVSLKVLPIAPSETTLVFELGQSEALARLHRWGGQPLPLNASRWVSESQGRGLLSVRLRGAVAAVEAACRVMGGERRDSAAIAADWDGCRDQCLPWFVDRAPSQCLWRLSVPRTAPELELPAGLVPLVEWHGALRWVKAPPALALDLRRAAAAVGGSASIFRASDDLSAMGISRFDALSAPLEQIHRRLKAEFDPAGILNRGSHFAGL